MPTTTVKDGTRMLTISATELINLAKGITHETDANHHGDSTDPRKRMGAAPGAAGSVGEHASE